MDHPVETKEEARQGERKGWVGRVLLISLSLAIAFMVVAYFIGVEIL